MYFISYFVWRDWNVYSLRNKTLDIHEIHFLANVDYDTIFVCVESECCNLNWIIFENSLEKVKSWARNEKLTIKVSQVFKKQWFVTEYVWSPLVLTLVGEQILRLVKNKYFVMLNEWQI